MKTNEQRGGVDRRRRPRGGRRAADVDGYAPMVLVIDEDSGRRDISEAILAKLRFAVAPFDSVEKAMAVMQALRPDVVVAGENDAQRLRGSLPNDRHRGQIPVVAVTEDLRTPEALIEAIRQALRTPRPETL